MSNFSPLAGLGAARRGILLARRHADSGGMMGQVPYFEREDIRQSMHPQGVIESTVPGRTDHIPLTVPAGSYVMPADVVSGLGEGNTNAGVRVLSQMLGTGPYGMPLRQGGHGGMGLPRPPAPAPYAKGGATKHKGSVPIMAAGGEFIIPPHVVQNHRLLGHGNMKRGHEVLDHWVKSLRKKHIKTLKKLPGPAR